MYNCILKIILCLPVKFIEKNKTKNEGNIVFTVDTSRSHFFRLWYGFILTIMFILGQLQKPN